MKLPDILKKKKLNKWRRIAHFFPQNAKNDSLFSTNCKKRFHFFDKIKKMFHFFRQNHKRVSMFSAKC